MTAGEKMEVIRLVEGSDLSMRRTLKELGLSRSTFYAWYRRYDEQGYDGLVAGDLSPLEPNSETSP
jgi:transposase